VTFIEQLKNLAKSWGLFITAVVAALTAATQMQPLVQQLLPGSLQWAAPWLVGAIAALPAVSLFYTPPVRWLWATVSRALVPPLLVGEDSNVFRLEAYSGSTGDRSAFKRDDDSHDRLVRWLGHAPGPILFLTGKSGVGKTSLLRASVIPALAESASQVRSLVVSGPEDPLHLLPVVKASGLYRDLPADLPAEAAPLLRRVVKDLRDVEIGAKLLVVFDQFEDFLARLGLPGDGAPAAGAEDFRKFLKDLYEHPVEGLTVLLVFRQGSLDRLITFLDSSQTGLPNPTEGTMQEVNAFTRNHARAFVNRAKPGLDPDLADDVIAELEWIEQTPGAIRPILLNMAGVYLDRLATSLRTQLTGRRPIGGFIKAYLKAALSGGEVPDVPRRTVRHMVAQGDGTAPSTLPQLTSAARASRPQVLACLLALQRQGLVRALDTRQEAWAITHDFVAGLFGEIISTFQGQLFHHRLASTGSYGPTTYRPPVRPVELRTRALRSFRQRASRRTYCFRSRNSSSSSAPRCRTTSRANLPFQPPQPCDPPLQARRPHVALPWRRAGIG
jgi:hypothetical protein